jgi:hypothetical protein
MPFAKTVALALSLTIGALSLAGNVEAHHRWDHAAAGAVGFSAGALLGSALARPQYYTPAWVYATPAPAPVIYGYSPWPPVWYTYCRGKFRSFDPNTGYYRGYDGQPHFCFGAGLLQAVTVCRDAIVKHAAQFGALSVDVFSAGRVRASGTGGEIASLTVRILYPGEVKEAPVECHLDTDGTVVAVEGASAPTH